MFQMQLLRVSPINGLGEKVQIMVYLLHSVLSVIPDHGNAWKCIPIGAKMIVYLHMYLVHSACIVFPWQSKHISPINHKNAKVFK